MRFKKIIDDSTHGSKYLCLQDIEGLEEVRHTYPMRHVASIITNASGAAILCVYYVLTTNEVAELLEEMRRLENEPRKN